MIPVKKLLAELLEERKQIDEAIANLEPQPDRRQQPKLALAPNPTRLDPSLRAGCHLAPQPGLGHAQLVPDTLQRQAQHPGGFLGAQSGEEPEFD